MLSFEGAGLGDAVLYVESAEVSLHSLARWPLRLQVAQTWRNLHDPGKAHRPLFHEEQIRSNVSSRIGLLMAAAGALVTGAGMGCREAMAH